MKGTHCAFQSAGGVEDGLDEDLYVNRYAYISGREKVAQQSRDEGQGTSVVATSTDIFGAHSHTADVASVSDYRANVKWIR